MTTLQYIKSCLRKEELPFHWWAAICLNNNNKDYG